MVVWLAERRAAFAIHSAVIPDLIRDPAFSAPGVIKRQLDPGSAAGVTNKVMAAITHPGPSLTAPFIIPSHPTFFMLRRTRKHGPL